MRTTLLAASLVLAALLPATHVSAQSSQDKAIALDIGNQLKTSGQLRDYRIGVKYKDGIAALSGTVANREQLQTALRLTQQMQGVDQVVNNLSIAKSNPGISKPAQQANRANYVGLSPDQVQATRTSYQQAQNGGQQPQGYGQQPNFRQGPNGPMQNGPMPNGQMMSPQMQQQMAMQRQAMQQQMGQMGPGSQQFGGMGPGPMGPQGSMGQNMMGPQGRQSIPSLDGMGPQQMGPMQQGPRMANRPRNNAPVPMGQQQVQQAMMAQQQQQQMQAMQAGCNCGPGGMGGGMGGGGYSEGMDVGPGGPMGAPAGGMGGGPSYDQAQMPGYAWPSYASYPNYAAITYPKQYSPSAWPYIGPFYPYPQVPLGWRKVCLEWDDGWWFLDFSDCGSNH
jgi:hypothetical protein